MGEIEYFATWTMFGFGVFLLIYLFAIRKRISRKVRLQMTLAKAKLNYHYISRPKVEDNVFDELDFTETIENVKTFDDVWGNEHSRKRDVR